MLLAHQRQLRKQQMELQILAEYQLNRAKARVETDQPNIMDLASSLESTSQKASNSRFDEQVTSLNPTSLVEERLHEEYLQRHLQRAQVIEAERSKEESIKSLNVDDVKSASENDDYYNLRDDMFQLEQE
jgi:hypothetical protein